MTKFVNVEFECEVYPVYKSGEMNSVRICAVSRPDKDITFLFSDEQKRVLFEELIEDMIGEADKDYERAKNSN